jgi:cell division septation protein DedD
VVLLFAVAFAMGYVVGQNSPRSSKLAGETAAANTPAPVPDNSRPAPASPAAPPAAAPAEGGTPPENADQAAPPAATEAAPPAAAPSAAASPATAAPPTDGTYWQVIAVAQSDADVIATGLKEKGFPVVLSPGIKNMTRVLVGPYRDKQALGRAKTELENAGFHPFLYK